MPYYHTGDEAIDYVRSQTDTVMLSFSRGKDSLAAWLTIKDSFRKIIPVFMYGVPHISFVDESLDYYEDFFGTHIVRVPHPSAINFLNGFGFQPPENCDAIESFGLPKLSIPQLFAEVAKDHGLKIPWMATGVRGYDNLIRQCSWKKHGSVTESMYKFHPVIDFRKRDVIDILHQHNVKLPYDYVLFSRTIDGTSWEYMGPLKEHCPEDYDRVKAMYPMVEAEIKRKEYANEAIAEGR